MGRRGETPQLFSPFDSKLCLRYYAFGVDTFGIEISAKLRFAFLGSLLDFVP